MIGNWRVVVVRTNGERMVVDERMSLGAATILRDRLTDVHAFPAIFMEPDESVEVFLLGGSATLLKLPRRVFSSDPSLAAHGAR